MLAPRSVLSLSPAPFALALTLAVVACSSGTGTNDSADPCSALSACCATIPSVEQGECESVVTAGREPGAGSVCAAELQSFAQSGLCTTEVDGGRSMFSFDGAVDTYDSSLACVVANGTSSCSTSGNGGTDTGDTYDAGTPTPSAFTSCVAAGSCAGGEAYETCVTMGSVGGCSAALTFPDGTSFQCASCTDCAAASVSATQYCETTVTTAPVDAGPDCGSAPALHPETEAGVYCPFTASGSVHCAAGEECCEAPAGGTGSTCQPSGATCPIAGSLAWECDGPVDCASSAPASLCCATGTVAIDPVCGFNRGTGFTGSHCANSCAATEVAICDQPTYDCATGTCTPFKVAGVVLGTCL